MITDLHDYSPLYSICIPRNLFPPTCIRTIITDVRHYLYTWNTRRTQTKRNHCVSLYKRPLRAVDFAGYLIVVKRKGVGATKLELAIL